MTATMLPRRPTPNHNARSVGRRSARIPQPTSGDCESGALGRYVDSAGRSREIVARPGAAGSVLVVDRDAATRADGRLVAHLGSEEPDENAGLMCDLYLGDGADRRCRLLTAADLRARPDLDDEHAHTLKATASGSDVDAPDNRSIQDRKEWLYHVEPVSARMSIPEMRWQQSLARSYERPARVLSLRHVIASLESYQPALSITREVLARHREDPDISVSKLRAETQRVCASRIVLNRGLREAVLEITKANGLSMSEIAIRCGRVKHDARGNLSGETSWLSRRLGLAPEGGKSHPTPWIHSDVLALIARRGLAISPREVELG
ncbi:MAG: hypothetical protein ACHQC8_04565 [Solirubrobacterales bacterium]